jgi:hypothetical protein
VSVFCIDDILFFFPMLTVWLTAKYTSESKAHIFNAGAPVWGIDWCPIHTNDRQGEIILPPPL